MTAFPILMVHGGFSGGWSFDAFAAPFGDAGHKVIAPDLPGHAPDAPREATLGLSMTDYAEAVVRHAAALAAPPILIGHSMGGLVSLLAAAKTPVAGVILLAPSAPWGVGGSSMEEAVSAVSLYALGAYWAQAIEPDYPSFRRYGVDRLEQAEQRAIFERMRPESGRALFETLNWWLDPFMTTMVRPEAIAAPILAIAGGRDAIHPPPTVRETARRVGAQLQVMPQMSHWLIGEPGWRDVADLCVGWIADVSATAAAAQ
ncbi:MAG TPA: alpha/beta hydrolase [Caulobacteraceae bacterium]|jgi:pimeloyl-ACP methyl ester carboxylesterase|nr:alpha/beta hydrolase [Caulobacteraceae bacterium]